MSASLWLRSAPDAWQRTPLAGEAYALTADPLAAVAVDAAVGTASTSPQLRSCRLRDRSCWSLLTPPAGRVWVSGRRVRGMQILRHRDSLWWPGVDVFYFSTERPATVEPFPGTDLSTFCVVCKTPVRPDQPAVRCPRCELWAHDDPASGHPCFSESESCPSCKRPNHPPGGFAWLPGTV